MNQLPNLSPMGQIKARARFVSLHSLWPILLALTIQCVLGNLFNIALSLADYQLFGTATEISILEMPFSVTYEVSNILLQLVLAPLSLGVIEFIQKLGRGLNASLGEIFSLVGDPYKRKIALLFSGWRIIFLTVTFPIRVIPLSYLSNQLTAFVQKINDGQAVTASALSTREVYIALVVLLIYGLICLPFLALPYVLTDQSRFGFFKCFRWSLHIMINHIPHFLLFLFSFIPFLVISSCLIILFLFLAVYFKVALAIFIDSIRRGEISGAYIGGNQQ